MDLKEQALRRGGVAVKIPGKIYQAMVVLIESPGDLVTREQLRSRLWPRDANLNYDANVNTTVNKLRQVLGDTSEGSNFIQTVPRRGYSFVAAVRYADAPAIKATEEKSSASANSRRFAALGEALRIGAREDLVYGERGDLGYGCDAIRERDAVARAQSRSCGKEFRASDRQEHRQTGHR